MLDLQEDPVHIFVTGASGWLGSAVVPELIEAGHQVTGLARSDVAAAALTKAGAQVQLGDLDDVDGLGAAAAASDGVIHLAFKHDIAFSGDFQGAVDADLRAIDALGSALVGSDKPFVIASGLLGLAPGQVVTEHDGQAPSGGAGDGNTRLSNAHATLALASRGVRSSVLRLPPTCHGDGDNGFMTTIIGIARDKGASGYVGDGSNRWPAVHQRDAAHLFRLAVEKAPAGSVLHAVGDEGVPIRDVATVIGRHLDVPVTAVPAGEAPAHFGWIGGFYGLDSPASATWTRETMGWQPTRPGLLDDLEEGHYFPAPSA